jgi:hypothetical protein
MGLRYHVLPDGEAGGICDCCGETTKRIWGYVETIDRTVAAYFVTWTMGRPEDLAKFELVVGPWGEGAAPASRKAVTALYGIHDGEGWFMVHDNDGSLKNIAAVALKRKEVIGKPIAKKCFDLLDAIWLGDRRLSEVKGWA